MENRNRSVIDSLGKLYDFLKDKYAEELKGYSKGGKTNKKQFQDKKSIDHENKNSDAKIGLEIISELNKNKKSSNQESTKVFNLKSKKIQKKNKRATKKLKPIDYDPIPFNFLSTKFKNTKTQIDLISEKNTKTQIDLNSEKTIKKHDYDDILSENYELVSYLTKNKTKSDFFSLWTKKYFYSVMRKQKSIGCSVKNKNSNQINEQKKPDFLFFSSSNSNININDKKNQKSEQKESNFVSDNSDFCADVVLSEYT